jgi:hypothetical protein
MHNNKEEKEFGKLRALRTGAYNVLLVLMSMSWEEYLTHKKE